MRAFERAGVRSWNDLAGQIRAFVPDAEPKSVGRVICIGTPSSNTQGGRIMYPIIESRWLAPDIRQLCILAPRIARKQQAGQFVIVRVHDHGERIPLTIAASDPEQGSITLIVQGVGKTTHLINQLQPGQCLLDVVGPLGKPSEVRCFGTVVVIGGGVGVAIAWPIAAALKQAGNQVVFILGARNRELLILTDEIRRTCDEFHITTDDGSAGRSGLVTDPLREIIDRGDQIDLVLAIGPIPMMRGVAEATRPHGIRTVVSLNSIMVDGTGMCGGCRVLIGGKARFACVDGPEFDAHLVDFDSLAQRNAMYRMAEQSADARFQHDSAADLARVTHQSRQACALLAEHPELWSQEQERPQ